MDRIYDWARRVIKINYRRRRGRIESKKEGQDYNTTGTNDVGFIGTNKKECG